MSAGGIDYEGTFTNKNLVEVTWKDANGNTGNSNLTFSDPQ